MRHRFPVARIKIKGRRYEKFVNLGLSVLFSISLSTSSYATAKRLSAGELEMLDWSNPELALQLVEAAPPSGRDSDSISVDMLAVRALTFANNNRYKAVDGVLGQLDAIAETGDLAAGRAIHYLRAYMASLQGQFPKAQAESLLIDFDAASSDIERYRLLLFQGYLSRMLGKDEVALPALEKASALAANMHDDHRSLCAALALGRLYLDSGDFQLASAKAEVARQLGSRWGDEGALADVWEFIADIADREGNVARDRYASLIALEHAKRSGSSKWLSTTLVSLSDSYLESGEYAESLKYSKQGLPIMLRRNDRVDIELTRFHEAMAYIGLGDVKRGQQLADQAIKRALAGDDLLVARDQLFQYERSLEQAGYLAQALAVYHRYTEANARFMTSQRQRAFMELSTQFDSERKAAEIDLLRRDDAIKSAQAREQRLALDKATAESRAASANASRADLLRNIAIYVGASLLLAIAATAWSLQRRRDLVHARDSAAERITVLGRLTGGIAHEFNNQLTVLQQALSLLHQKPYVQSDPDGKALVEELQDSSRSLAYTTTQLQCFGRQQHLRASFIQLSDFLESNRVVLERMAGHSASIDFCFVTGSVSAWADERQLLAALMNLVANARDAVGSNGRILIEVAEVDTEFVRISVIDDGTGMEADTLRRASEPFFSTKAVGAGTGLGLSMVSGFVNQSGGYLELRSEPGHGCSVTMILRQRA